MTHSENKHESKHESDGQDPAQQDHGWEPCTQGLLTGAVRKGVSGTTFSSASRTSTIDRRRMMAIAAGATFVAATATIASRYYTPADTLLEYGGISCAEVSAKIEAYIAQSLDEAIEQQIDQHLAKCNICRSRYESMIAQNENQQS